MNNPLKYFAELRDPRVERNREHILQEILLIAIAAVLSGAESWNDIAAYGEDKLEWLQTFLTLPSKIPSHDTFIECRWHDLRHSAASRMAAGGATDQTLQALLGWMSPR